MLAGFKVCLARAGSLAHFFHSPLITCHSLEGAASPTGNFAAPRLPSRTCVSRARIPLQPPQQEVTQAKLPCRSLESYSQLLGRSQPGRSRPFLADHVLSRSPSPLCPPSLLCLEAAGSASPRATAPSGSCELLTASRSSPASFLHLKHSFRPLLSPVDAVPHPLKGQSLEDSNFGDSYLPPEKQAQLADPRTSTESTSHGSSEPAEPEVSDWNQQHREHTTMRLPPARLCCELPRQGDAYALRKAI